MSGPRDAIADALARSNGFGSLADAVAEGDDYRPDADAVLAVLRERDDVILDAAESFYAIRRTDGELIGGEYGWGSTDGPDDWTWAEAADHWDPVEFEIVRMYAVPVATRTFGEPSEDDEDEAALGEDA